MADILNLTPSPVLVTGGGSAKTQPVEQAIDVSAYDWIDLAIDAPGGTPGTVVALSSMTLQEADADWVQAAITTGSIPGNSFNHHLEVPASGQPLFRYIRWKITPGGSNGSATISGLARRG